MVARFSTLNLHETNFSALQRPFVVIPT